MFKQLIAVLVLLSVIVGLSEAKEVFKILGDAPMGSKRRPVEAKSPIPFNKEYDQLTEKQRKLYRLYWKDLPSGDTPPFPKGGTRSIYKPLIKGHQRLSRSGWLRLIAKIDEGGNVEEVAVYETPHKEITDLANSVLFHTKFIPATCSGEPCKMNFPFEFKLRKRFMQMNTLNAEDIPGL